MFTAIRGIRNVYPIVGVNRLQLQQRQQQQQQPQQRHCNRKPLFMDNAVAKNGQVIKFKSKKSSK